MGTGLAGARMILTHLFLFELFGGGGEPEPELGEFSLLEQWQLLWGFPFALVVGGEDAISGTPVDKYIVDFDGDMFQLTILDTGELEFSDDFEQHTAPSDVASPVYTEE